MKIEALKPSKRIKGRWLAELEDGSILRVGENEVVAFALHSGKELTPELADALIAAAHKSGLQEKALNALAQKPLSGKELQRKVKQWEGSDEEAEAICARMEELGLINDASYADLLAQHYRAKGYGPRKIKDEFFKRGIDRSLWDAVLQNPDEDTSPIDRFIQQKLKGTTPDDKEIKRVSDALLRRGFSWGEVREALRRYGTEIWED